MPTGHQEASELRGQGSGLTVLKYKEPFMVFQHMTSFFNQNFLHTISVHNYIDSYLVTKARLLGLLIKIASDVTLF